MVDYDDALFQPAAYTVNVNVAEWPELAQLPGVGPSLARRIVEFRVEHGALILLNNCSMCLGSATSRYAVCSRTFKIFPAMKP